MRWVRGSFEVVMASGVPGSSVFADGAVPQLEDEAEAVVVKGLLAFPGERLSAGRTSRFNAIDKLTSLGAERFGDFSRSELQEALNRLVARDAVCEVPIGKDNSRRQLFGLRFVPDKLSKTGATETGFSAEKASTRDVQTAANFPAELQQTAASLVPDTR